MAYFRYNRILLFFIALGLIASLVIVWQRHKVETSNSTVELVMDYEDISELAQVEGTDRTGLFKQFREAGITTLAVYDVTLEKLHKSGQVSVIAGSDLLSQSRTGLMDDSLWRKWLATGQIAPEFVYVAGANTAEFNEVRTDLLRRFAGRVTELSGGSLPVLAIKGNYEKLIKVDLGISSAEVKETAAQGFYVIPRPVNYTQVQSDDIRAFFSRIQGVNAVSAVIFSGKEVLGYPQLTEQTLAGIKQQNLTIGLIEHPVQLQFYPQAGLLPLVPENNFKVARVYSIPKDEQPKLLLEAATNRWALSDQERNIRINLMRNYDKPDPGKTLIETNLQYVEATKKAIEAKGYSIGKAGVFAPYFPDPWLLSLAAAGVIAAGTLFLTQICPLSRRIQYGIFVVLSLMFVAPILAGGGTLVRQIAGLGAAVLFPVLAMTWQLDRWRHAPQEGECWIKRVLRDGVGGLVLAFLVSLMGGLYLAALLADVRFLLEMEIFRGVKLTFILPLMLVAIVYLTRFNLFEPQDDRDAGRIIRQVINLLNYPVSIKVLMLFGVGALGAWIFIGRSGHTAGVPVPAFEIKLRALLEQVMYARPREKEFMIGHPAFLLAAMAAARQWPRLLHFLLVIAATIGQSTLVETFAHLRTPVLMSLIRGIDGLWLGALVGIVLVVAVHFLACLSSTLMRRAFHE
ncbi:MAG: hypothetical protein K0Q77_2515 [Anaerosporomusa subterranea]|jgi:hypothetical protein|nr:hypothetical protein [Anaerosporomusa subterranea]